MATAGLVISYAVLGLALVCGSAFAMARQHFKPIVTARLSQELPPDLASRVVDEVTAGQSASEGAHDLLIRGQMNVMPFTPKTQPGEGEAANSAPETNSLTQRTAMQGGSFGYRMKVLPDQPMSLNCLYWGGERAQRTLDIVVNDQIIATQELITNAPGHFLDVEYKIPRSLTAGQNQVLVEFQAHPDLTSGKIFFCQTLKR